jgi:hypothetical protein
VREVCEFRKLYFTNVELKVKGDSLNVWGEGWRNQESGCRSVETVQQQPPPVFASTGFESIFTPEHIKNTMRRKQHAFI